jgi:dynein heavy chain
MLIREVHWLERMGFTIPDAARSVFNQRDKLKSTAENLKYMVAEYYRVLGLQDKVYKGMLKPAVDRLNIQFDRGVNSLTWMSINIDAYMNDVFVLLNTLEETISKANDILTHRLNANCDSIMHTYLIAFTNDVRTIQQFMADNTKFAKNMATGIEIKNNEIEAATDDLIHLLTFKYNKDEKSTVQRECKTFREYFENRAFEAVVACLRSSVKLLKERISGQAQDEDDAGSSDEPSAGDEENPKKKMLGIRPVFSAQLTLLIPNIRLSPSLEEIQRCVNRTARIMLESTKHIYKWNQDRSTREGCQSIYEKIGENRTTIKGFLQLTGAIAGLSNKINNFIETFHEYHFLWKKDRIAAIHNFTKDRPRLDDFEAQIRYFSEIGNNLDNMKQYHKMGSLLLDMKPIMLALKTEALQWKYAYGQALNGRVKKKVDKLTSFIDEMTQNLQRKITDLDSVNQTMEVLEKIRDIESKIDAKMTPIEEATAVLKRYDIKSAKEEEEAEEKDISYKWNKLRELAREVMDYLVNVGPTFRRDLLTKVKSFTLDVREFKQLYDEKGPMEKGIQPRTAQTRLKMFQSSFEERHRKWKTYSMGERLFGLPETQYPELIKIEKDLGYLTKLYELYSDVTMTVNGFEDIVWADINIEEMTNVLGNFSNRCKLLPTGLRKWEAYVELKQTIENFYNTLPILELLNEKSIKDRHWAKISQLCGKELDYKSPEFKVKHMIEAKIIDHKDDVEEIINAASREGEIEIRLGDIRNEWSTKTFALGGHKQRGNMIIKDTGELLTSLEESQVLLSTLLGNLYNEPFKNEIQTWMIRLSTSQTVIDDWLKVQGLWIYMEAVFTGGDIAKELPAVAKRFATVDRLWVQIMSTADQDPNVLRLCVHDETISKMLPELRDSLEKCQKSLSGYLEAKRMIFPRFFFLSDTQLLEILGQGSDPTSIQRHLLSIFSNIAEVEFDSKVKNQIVTMKSAEGEVVQLSEPLLAQGNIEIWLNKLVTEMRDTINDVARNMSASLLNELASPDESRLEKFIRAYPSQISLLGLQLLWTWDSEMALRKARTDRTIMQLTRKKFDEILKHLVKMTTKKLEILDRTRIETLITIHIHQVEIFAYLMHRKIRSPTDFEWLKQTRFYWKGERDRCFVCITDNEFEYCNEFLGCTDRLVITPLTDRIYISCAQAMGMFLGGAPAGPAGTGKTETTKDMGRTIGKYFITINCSDQMGHLSMAMLFKGIAQGGVWCGFDEVNRVELEVLSVVASQIKCLFDALRNRMNGKQFQFVDGTSLVLDDKCAVFITMNPGYAGRTELPENMKALFRTIAVVVPNRRIIMKVKLAACGFQTNNILSKKFNVLYKLCEEQLSAQTHYDFGLRNILSVLRTCGRTLRESNEKTEEGEMRVLMRVLNDMNSSKLVDEDSLLFVELIKDMFPNMHLGERQYEGLEQAIEESIVKKGFISHKPWIQKITQLYEQYKVRHGLCIMGPSGTGKTSCIEVLAQSITKIEGITKVWKMNPKAITASQMFGMFVDPTTKDWTDGIFSALWRKSTESGEKKENTWICLDGPVDAVWIENLNTVLDDTRSLTLANGDRLNMPKTLKLVFEVGNLDNASPATVSRMGMVYIGETVLGWQPIFEAWLKKHNKRPEKEMDLFKKLFLTHVDAVLAMVEQQCKKMMDLGSANMISTVLRILDGLFNTFSTKQYLGEKHIERMFVFSVMWGIGGLLEFDDRVRFHKHMMIERRLDLPKVENLNAVNVGASSMDTVFEYVIDENGEWRHWKTRVTAYKYPTDVTPDFNSILVPTVDSVRCEFLIDIIAKQGLSVLLIGESGTAKSVTIQGYIQQQNPSKYKSKSMAFSSATTPGIVQNSVFTALDKRMGTTYGPPLGNTLLIFIDDINMPEINEWGDQVTNEIVRQLIENGGFYSLELATNPGQFLTIVDVQFFAAMNHPGGGRNDIPNRLKRQFSIFNVTFPSTKSIDSIFGTICEGHFCKARGFSDEIINVVRSIPSITRSLWSITKAKMLPTPSKFHYIFNLRDLSRICQGMLQATSDVVKSEFNLMALWKHECDRVLQDKFTDDKDRLWFQNAMRTLLKDEFGEDMSNLMMKPKFFVDFMREEQPDESQQGGNEEEPPPIVPKVYEPIDSFEALQTRLQKYLMQYNEVNKRDPMSLVLFEFAMIHLMRISRIIRTDRGNALLVGVGGSGKQSLTRLAAFVAGYKIFKLNITKTYTINNMMDDLRNLYKMAVLKSPVAFLFTDNDVKDEQFLEYVNMILTSGEIPGLFTKEDQQMMTDELRPIAAKSRPGFNSTPENLFKFFIDRARDNLHVVLCFSPVGDVLRNRTRKFPGIISGCTIDWFPPWPIEALHATAEKFLLDLPQLACSANQKAELVNHMCNVHESVVQLTKDYFNKYRRNTYVTPKSYLSFIGNYKSIYAEKYNEVKTLADKVNLGLQKLDDASKGVAVMKEDLLNKEKELAVAQRKSEILLEQVTKQKIEAEEQTEKVLKKKAEIEERAAVVSKEKSESERDLENAKPALEQATKAVNSLDKDAVNIVKGFKNPPELVTRVMDTVLLIQSRPISKKVETVIEEKEKKVVYRASWKDSLMMMSDLNFVGSLQKFSKEITLNDETIELLHAYLREADLDKEKVRKSAEAAGMLCHWVKCMCIYYETAKFVAPKQQRVRDMEIEMSRATRELNKAETDVRKQQAELDKMKEKLDSAMSAKKALEEDALLTKRRMESAEALIEGLSTERIRWTNDSKNFDDRILKLVGDVCVTATFLSYAGPFNQDFRAMILKQSSIEDLRQRKIPFTDSIDVIKFLINPTQIGEWIIQGLPNDEYSSQNGIIVTKGTRYPLLIDPQGQGKAWITKMEAPNNLVITTLNAKIFRESLENCVQLGQPLLLEDIGEELDPILDPIMDLMPIKSGTGKRIKVKIGDKEVNYKDGFKLYMTTKLANPRYSPELFALSNIIDFTVTSTGLEDQLLGIVIVKEMYELEKKRKDLMEEIQTCKEVMAQCEEELLNCLSQSKKNLLDDDSVIELLAKAKERSRTMTEKLAGSVETEKNITAAREEFRPVAARGSVMYFVMTELSLINCMYQVSLNQFIKLFIDAIDRSEQDRTPAKRIENIIQFATFSIFKYVQRGLYEQHKTTYALLLALKIDLKAGIITHKEFQTLIKAGAALHINDVPRRKPFIWIPDPSWVNLCALSELPKFKTLLHQVEMNESGWKELYDSKNPELAEIPDGYKLNSFHTLLLVRCWRLDRTMASCAQYIMETLGEQFVNSIPLNIEETWNETVPTIPIICLLSMGSDLTTAIENLAQANKISLERVSMGQGQEKKAHELVRNGLTTGGWVLLQNCHLGLKYLPVLEQVLTDLNKEEHDHHFRVWITSEPTPKFPINLLQMSIKVTDDPPTGIKASLLKSYSLISQEKFDQIETPEWRKLVYATCFLHATLIERKKFGALGWCVPYEFNQTDLDCALHFLAKYMYETDNKKLSWSTVRYMICDVQYGGRVTDDYDRELLDKYGAKFYDNKLFNKEYQFHTNYYCPDLPKVKDYREYVANKLPMFDPPEVFGLHSNAEIAFNSANAGTVLETIMNIQPKESSSGSGETREDFVLKQVKTRLEELPPDYNIVYVKKRVKQLDKDRDTLSPLSIFLRQEIDRMQIVLSLVRRTLTDLKLAIAGTIVMSPDLQGALNAIYDAQVPIKWKKVSWDSPTLGYWFADVLQRNEQYVDWLENGPPKCFWISGFFNSPGFLTAVKQQSTRNHNGWSLESVSLKTEVTKKEKEQIQASTGADAMEGVHIWGLFLDGAAWDKKNGRLTESQPKILFNPLPVIYISVNQVQGGEMGSKDSGGPYICPVYRLPRRTAPNYIFDITLKCEPEPPSKYTLMGVAALCSKH